MASKRCSSIKLLSLTFVSKTFNITSKIINNSCAKHKGNHSREGVFICDKTHVDFHKTFASIFSAYTTSILKILS